MPQNGPYVTQSALFAVEVRLYISNTENRVGQADHIDSLGIEFGHVHQYDCQNTLISLILHNYGIQVRIRTGTSEQSKRLDGIRMRRRSSLYLPKPLAGYFALCDGAFAVLG